MKEFDPLFFSRSCMAIIGGRGVSRPSLRTSFETLYNQIFIDRIQKIILECTFSDLRSLPIKSNYNGGSVSFIFHQNAYEIEFSGTDKSISKLYHQFLTTNEINQIIATIGNWFYNNIERELEKK